METNMQLVSQLANLARLHFTDEEMKAMQGDLAKMIAFVEKLNELDTQGVEPLMHMSAAQNVFREDEAGNPVEAGIALQNAQNHTESFFNVPKVLP